MDPDRSAGFTLHWSRVGDALAAEHAPPGSALVALWPAPVNPDACFQAAGFTDFGDADEAWERQADETLDRLLGELSVFGPPRLVSEPLRTRPGLIGRLTGVKGEPLPLAEQLAAAAHVDSLPDAVVAFGPAARLRVGNGHLLWWITLPADRVDGFAATALPRVAAEAPLCRTDLDWKHLLA
jgi:hypothetical protein